MPQAPSITFLWVASRISKGGTIAPPGSASILRLPPVSLSTRSAKNLKASCVVDDGGTADCIFRIRGCWASAVPANARAIAPARIALVGQLLFIAAFLLSGDCRRVIGHPGEAYRRPGALSQSGARLLKPVGHA